MGATNALVQVGSDEVIGGQKPPGPELHMAIAVTQLGYSAAAALASIAFVVFDPSRNNVVVDTYHAPLDWTSQEGREVSSLKLKYFLGLSTVTRRVLHEKEPVGDNVAIGKLQAAISTHHPKVIWGNPVDLGQLTNFMLRAGTKGIWPDGVSLRDSETIYKSGRELGIASEVTRGQFEPEGHSMGDASFIMRQVRAVYAPKEPEVKNSDQG